MRNLEVALIKTKMTILKIVAICQKTVGVHEVKATMAFLLKR